ncbi:MAG: GNAT family N-acetyltransferase [Sphingobium sp.]|nr:GNAT family N-acetyltransferase [Sphingobium sp.]
MIVTDERVARFVSEKLGFGLCPPYSVVGIEVDGQIIGGVLLNFFEGADVHISVAGRGWGRDFLRRLGEYVFDQLGCLRATLITEQPAVISLGKKLGGEVEGCLRNHFGTGRDGTIIGILRENYRYGRLPEIPAPLN